MSLPVRGLPWSWDLGTTAPWEIRDDSHIKGAGVRCNINMGLYNEKHLWLGSVKRTGCGLHVCPGSRAMSVVLSGRVIRNSSESTSVPSSSQTRDRDTADRDSSNAWHTCSTDSSCSGLMCTREKKSLNTLNSIHPLVLSVILLYMYRIYSHATARMRR